MFSNKVGALPICVTVLVVTLSTLAYKKDYGLGFMFKYEPNFKERVAAETSLVDNIRSVMNYYKKGQAEGLSFARDPLPIDSLVDTFSGMKLTLDELQLYGLSRLRIDELKADLSEMKIDMKLSIDELSVLGRYLLSAWISKPKGMFNVSITALEIPAVAKLSVDEDDGVVSLRVLHMDGDIKVGGVTADFEKLGFLRKMLRGVVNKIGAKVLDSMKPTIWFELSHKLQEIIDNEVKDVAQQFPKSINPVDKYLVHIRKAIRNAAGLEPVALADYSTQSTEWSRFELFRGQLHGLSLIRRTGPILLGFENDTIHMAINLGAENLQGTYDWEWTAFRNLITKRGSVNFILDTVNVDVRLIQSSRFENKPVIIGSINMTLGQTQLESDGLGIIHYIIQSVFNVEPNLFRQRITEAAEYPLLKAVEDELLKINIEGLVDAHENV